MSLDYSKWDRFVADLSDDEEEKSKGRPQLTTFDAPQSITIPGKGAPIAMSPAPRPTHAPLSSARAQDIASSSSVTAIGNPREAKGGIQPPSLCRNGAEFENYAWCQDQEEVTVTYWVALGTRGKDVKVSISPKESNQALVISIGDKRVFEEELAYKVDIEDDFDGGVDWQLKNIGSKRGIVITLRKNAPIKNLKAVFWWSRLTTREKKIETSKIVDRRKSSTGSFKKNFEEAHRLFREKIAKQTPTYIDDDGNIINGSATSEIKEQR